MFTDQFDMPLKTKLKGSKGYDKVRNVKDCVEILEIIRSVICFMGEYIQGTWAMMKANKRL